MNNFACKSLNDIVTTHIQIDTEEIPLGDAGASGDLSGHSSAFLAVTNNEWKKYGILFVYTDTEQTGFSMVKSFFLPKDVYMMLSSIMFGDEECAQRKEEVGIRHDEPIELVK